MQEKKITKSFLKFNKLLRIFNFETNKSINFRQLQTKPTKQLFQF